MPAIDPVAASLLAAGLTLIGALIAQLVHWLLGRRRLSMTAEDRARASLSQGQQALLGHLETRLALMEQRADAAYERQRAANHRANNIEQKLVAAATRAEACERERLRDHEMQSAMLGHIKELAGMLRVQGIQVPDLVLPVAASVVVETMPAAPPRPTPKELK